NKAKQCRVGQRTEAVDRRQFSRRPNNLPDFLVAVNVGTSPAIATWNQGVRDHLMSRIDAVKPLGKESNHTQAVRPGLSVRMSERLLPFQEEIGADEIGAFLRRKFGKSA